MFWIQEVTKVMLNFDVICVCVSHLPYPCKQILQNCACKQLECYLISQQY
ncbi:Uncharacterised protein [Enterobacter hormaechei]|nr:Uncharacterised protein [Enterobacter hormaechei]DAI81880.1 MAG TPA: hypothetical protein [Caudoviricetes sp.]CZW05408.1 Uncharacterised protein [Enterobacter hormaechei]CZW49834.1 Uncharacterised protein [Enterobacter hormaechei]SAD44951.1 Uncharacterised protein [Enterobacter hormaechei]